mgnify:CR=1 FL=1
MRIDLSPDQLMRQAASTAEFYMGRAVERIDAQFGEGFAKANPPLVAAFMRTAGEDFKGSMLTNSLWELGSFLSFLGSEVEAASERQAAAIQSLANAVYPANVFPSSDAIGGHVLSLTEATMGVTGGLVRIAEAVGELAAKVNDVASVLADQEAS